MMSMFTWTGNSAQGDRSEVEKLADDNTAFAMNLYQQVKGTEGNLFFSPYSISTALGMTYAGARGDTARQMSEVLRFSLEGSTLHSTFGDLEAHLNGIREKGEIELNVANALWSQKDYPFLEDFLERVKKNYRAELEAADFKTAFETVRGQINAWVEKQTHDKIRNLLSPGMIDNMTRLVLVNAIYFKGMWATQFEKSATNQANFWLSAETSIDVPMMSQEQEFNYMEDNELQMIELPYAGKDLSMGILLPKKRDGLGDLEISLTVENLDNWISRFNRQRVRVHLPRFTITSQFSLAKTLTSMGMPDAFTPGTADFSGIDGTRNLFLSAVVHKAFVDVNEEGTEAAAATGAVVAVTALPPKPLIFRADHPFLFLIRDNDTGSILFLGRVSDPTK